MKKRFLFLAMVFLGLMLSATSAWGTEGRYYAKLTGKTSTKTTGSGKVYVSAINDGAVNNWASKRHLDSYPSDEQWAAWVEGESNVEYVGSIAAADGIDAIAAQFYAYAKADDGSYFTGWSFSDGATDEGEDATLGLKLFPSKTRATMSPDDTYGTDEYGNEIITSYGTVVNYNAKEYVLFASFEKLLIESYAISGETTTAEDGEGNWKCEQTVTFRIAGKEVDVNDFYDPTLTKKAGTAGTWTKGEVTATAYAEYGEIVVPVTFTADNDNAGEFSATLLLRSKAGKTMNVVLSARTTGGDYQAVRYNSAKVQYEGVNGSGTLSSMLDKAVAGDIIKLNDDYDGTPVTINKNITFDLNGFDFETTLAIGGDVTIPYSPYGGEVTGTVTVNTNGKLTANGGVFSNELRVSVGAEAVLNGATVGGSVDNDGTLTLTDGELSSGVTSAGTLTINGGTINNNDGVAIEVTDGNAQIKKGTITGSTYGVKTTDGETTIRKLAAITGGTKALYGNGGSLTVNNGKFSNPTTLYDGTITFNAGYFQTATGSTALGKQVWRNTAGAEAREGYAFFVGDQEAALASNVSVCRIGQAAYASLEEALTYANNHTAEQVTIFMENDYTLKAGYYTLPSNATLIVPMSNEQQTANQLVPRVTEGSIATPVSFRKLILEKDVNLEVAGTIELTCQQYGKQPKMGVPGGKYGHLIMKQGSHMTINNGGELRAWGFVTGDGTKDAEGNYLSGEIDARRGGTVREMFQMGDWKGGDISFTMILDQYPQNITRLFPVYMYFIQNVESPVKYHPGSSLICATSVNVTGGVNAFANDIKVVGKEGEAAMFLMDEMADAENTWVRKYYDAKKDQQVYEVNSGAKLGSMVIDLGEVPGVLFGSTGKFQIVLDSRKFVLPLTSNMKIHLLSGSMEFTQSTSCLPGMEVEVDKESEISIIPNSDPTVTSGALYFYDADQWSFMNLGLGGYVGVEHAYGAKVNYSATWDLDPAKPSTPNVRDISSPAAIGDAKLIVHGTFRSAEDCSVYTTWSKNMSTFLVDENGTGGASIISTNEDAGTFIFDDASPAFDGLHYGIPPGSSEPGIVGFGNSVLVNFDNNDYSETLGVSNYPISTGTALHSDGHTRMFGFELCTPAMLKNGDGTFVATEGSPAGRSYCYMNDKWTSMIVAPENECFMKDQDDIFYAKPAEYVAVVATYDDEEGVVKGNDDHTFSDLAGAGRLFIVMDDCQWWEVEKKDNLYHCIHPNNDTYYYWDETEGKWMEQRFTITWKNYDGSEIKSYTYDPVTGDPEEVEYSVTYGTQAEFLGSNPTRPEDIDYTYNFTGWSPALGKVTSDVTYTATYEAQPRKYAIIFQNEGGDEIERHFLTHNEVPACENTPTRTGFTLEWEPAISAVTGDATYRATWLENPPTEYQVTFFDYDGETVLQQGNVAVGAMPEYAGETPTGKATWAAAEENKEFTYVFHDWSPAPETVSATSVKSYVAVYDEVPITYTVIFKNENGSEIERHEYTWGETPVCSATPTKANTAEFTYSFAWDPQIQTVQGAATYRATFPATKNKYTVALRCNIPGACTFTGAGLYDYGQSASVAATPTSGYEFVKWSERSGGADLGSLLVNGDITLTAIVKVEDTPLPGNLELGLTGSEESPAASYTDITITSDGVSQSSQILNAGNITTLYGNADFVLSKDFAGSTWYCVAVPWCVDVNGGIFLNGTTPAVLGKNMDICYYDGSVRAAQGKVDACWVYMKNLGASQRVLQPGRAYMIALKDGASSITFRKKAQEPLLTTNTSVQSYPSATATDAGWNAIANPSLFHAYVNAGTTDHRGQRYLSESDTYDWFYLNAHKLVVGEPAYVQAPAAKSIVVANGASYAPARRMSAAVQPTSFDVNITAAGAAKYADHISISLNEDKEENRYIIGQDLVKFGVSSKVAQMWIDRYDAKLCVNTVAPEGDATNFPMSIFAPKAGSYTIAIEREVNTDDYVLYLTYNGEAIWNLSDGAYVAHLNKGTDSKYGLRVSARAPQITTGIDEAVVDAQGETRKVLINDQVFIIRGDKVYSVDGRLVK